MLTEKKIEWIKDAKSDRKSRRDWAQEKKNTRWETNERIPFHSSPDRSNPLLDVFLAFFWYFSISSKIIFLLNDLFFLSWCFGLEHFLGWKVLVFTRIWACIEQSSTSKVRKFDKLDLRPDSPSIMILLAWDPFLVRLVQNATFLLHFATIFQQLQFSLHVLDVGFFLVVFRLALNGDSAGHFIPHFASFNSHFLCILRRPAEDRSTK